MIKLNFCAGHNNMFCALALQILFNNIHNLLFQSDKIILTNPLRHIQFMCFNFIY